MLKCVVVFFSSRRRHTRCALVTGVQTCALPIFFGANETAKLINGAERDASQGERIYRSAERAGNAQGARKYDRIGNVMEQAGRWINRPSRDRQTSSTRRPTY